MAAEAIDPEANQKHVRDQVAEQFGVSSGYVLAAQKIIAASPGLAEQIRAGVLSLHAAQVALGMRKPTVSLKSSYIRIRAARAGLGVA